MFRQAVSLLGWMVAAAVGFWIHDLQRQNLRLADKLRASERALAQARNESRDESQRHLLAPQNSNGAGADSALTSAPPPRAERPPPPLPAPKAPPVDPTEVQAAQKRVADLQAQLKRLNADNQAIDVRSQSYRQKRDAQAQQENVALVARVKAAREELHDLDEQIKTLRAQKKSSAQQASLTDLQQKRGALNSERLQLEADVRTNVIQEKSQDSAIHQEVLQEKSEITAERAHLQSELEQARQQLEGLRQRVR